MTKDNKNFAPFLNNETFNSAMTAPKKQREVIAENFLYKLTFMMMGADPGVGKSTLSTQVAVELAAGLPIFGTFKVPRPMKVLYIQAERDILEFTERVKEMSSIYPIVSENIYATDAFQKLNLVNEDHSEQFIETIKSRCPDIDVIMIDPIYATVRGGLKDDGPASCFTHTMSILQKELNGPLIWYNHHNSRAIYQAGKLVIKQNPLYGSQWLIAHPTGQYAISYRDQSQPILGSQLTKIKDNYNILPDKIILDYDPETGISSINSDELSGIDKLNYFLDLRERDKKEFDFKEMMLYVQVCKNTLLNYLLNTRIRERLNVHKGLKGRKIYKINSTKK